MSRKVKWEIVLRNVDELIKQSNAGLYERVVLLQQVWDDPEFLAFHKSDVDEAEDHLNQKLGDYGITFFDAAAMLKHFPDRAEWASSSIRDLLAKALDLESSARTRHEAPKPERKKPIARDEHERIKSELETQVQILGKRSESLADECSRLRSENQELRRENAELRGRLQELERVLKRQLAEA